MAEVIPDLHWLEAGMANVYLYQTGDELTLVDTGMPGRAQKILGYVRAIGRQPSDIKRILITHADWDHAGSLAALQKETGARVIAGPETAGWLQEGKSPQHLPGPLHFLMDLFAGYGKVPAATITEVEDEQEVPGAGNLQALATPGHTPDHFAFYDPQAGILFAGDALNTRDGAPGLSARFITADVQAARASALRLLSLTPALFACGHGRPLSDHSLEDVMKLMQQLKTGSVP